MMKVRRPCHCNFISYMILALMLIGSFFMFSSRKCTSIVVHKEVSGRFAYVTLATTRDAVIAIGGLAGSMSNVLTRYPLIALITSNITETQVECLRSLNIIVKTIDKILPPKQVQIAHMVWKEALNKLWIWTLTDYDKLIYLDADTVLMKNIDEFFEFPELTGAYNVDVDCVRPMGDNQPNRGGLNAAVLVLVPSLDTYAELLKVMDNGNKWENSDQGIVEAYFEGKSKLNLFSLQYVSFARCCFAPWFRPEHLKVAHFTHWAVDFYSLAQEPVDTPHFKNWSFLPNCDVEYYGRWKLMYHKNLESHPTCKNIV